MFKQMENLTNFLKACRAIGVPSFDCFETLDLFDEKNMLGVLRCVSEVDACVCMNVCHGNRTRVDGWVNQSVNQSINQSIKVDIYC